MIKKSLLFSLFGVSAFYFAQEAKIDTVYVFDKQMNKVKLFHKVETIKADDVEKNSSNLSELLRFQTPIYIKENGRGATSSPSFRGTTAQQTAFVWNGININSIFLGQGDINNIPLFGYDDIEVKAGGGSVIYGSGAIGGSIHLNNDLNFNKGVQASLFSEVASFGTFNNFAKASYSNEKFSFKFSGNYSISQNDYEVKDMNFKNINGRYYNTTFNIAASYKLNPHNRISWQSQHSDASQRFPIYYASETGTKYLTQGMKSLISWDYETKNISNSLKAAFVEDQFQYYNTIYGPKFSGGDSKIYIIKDDFNYFINPKLNFNLLSEFQSNHGEGDNNGISKVRRNVGSFAGLLRYFPSSKLRFEGGIKKDLVENVQSPILFSFSGKWKAADWYNLNFNVSKNFRYPSFNDSYYQPGGNLDLKSETSMQGDLDNEFKTGDFKLVVSPYYIRTKNLIVWLPTSMGYWSAFNIQDTESYGLESELSFTKKIGEHSLRASAGYYYTHSINFETKKQLTYVPLHRGNFNLDYLFKFLKLYAQGVLNGLTYTNANEDRNSAIDPYFVMNAGISGTLQKKYTLGFKVNNITDTYYKTVSFYPMPKRNYSVYANINF